MLSLCLYVYYSEKQAIKRYLLVIFSFVCALMSKPMVVTLPVIMILLDYWRLDVYVKERQLGFMAVAGKNTFFYFVSYFFCYHTFCSVQSVSKTFFFLFTNSERACFFCDLPGEDILAS